MQFKKSLAASCLAVGSFQRYQHCKTEELYARSLAHQSRTGSREQSSRPSNPKTLYSF